MNALRIQSTFLFLILLNCFSCKKPECMAVIDYGEFELQPESYDVFPFSYEHSTIVFSDENGQEYNAKRRAYGGFKASLTSSTGFPCEYDDSVLIPYTYKFDTERAEFKINELDLPISFYMFAFVGKETSTINTYELTAAPESFVKYVSSRLNVTVGDGTFSRGFAQLIVDPGNNPEPNPELLIPLDSIDINGVTYFDVFTNTHTSNYYNIYYNKEMGLVGITRDDGSLSLKFERLE